MAANLEIKVQVDKVSPQPGDILVVRVAPEMTAENARLLRDQLVALTPEGVRTMIIPRNLDFSTMTDADLDRLGLQRKFI